MEAGGGTCDELIPLSRVLYECLHRQLQLSSEVRFGTSVKRKSNSSRDHPSDDLTGAVAWTPCSRCGLWVSLSVQRVANSENDRTASGHPWEHYGIPSLRSLLCASCKERQTHERSVATTTLISVTDSANWKFFVRCSHPKCGKFRKVPRLFPGTTGWVCGMLPWERGPGVTASRETEACDVPSVKLGFSSLKGKWGKVEAAKTAKKGGPQKEELKSKEEMRKAMTKPDAKPRGGVSVTKPSRKKETIPDSDDDAVDSDDSDDDEGEEEEDDEEEEEESEEEEEAEEEESAAEDSEGESADTKGALKEKAKSHPLPRSIQRSVQPETMSDPPLTNAKETNPAQALKKGPSNIRGSNALPKRDSSAATVERGGQQPQDRSTVSSAASRGGGSSETSKKVKSAKRRREDSPMKKDEDEDEVQPWALCDRCQTWRMTKERVNEDCPYWECSMEPGLRCEPFVRFDQALFTRLESLLEKAVD